MPNKYTRAIPSNWRHPQSSRPHISRSIVHQTMQIMAVFERSDALHRRLVWQNTGSRETIECASYPKSSRAGTYAIHTPDGTYVGTANSVATRFNSHRGQLRKGTHHSPKLQAAHDKHGMQSMRFELVSTADDRYAEEDRYGVLWAGRLLNAVGFLPGDKARAAAQSFVRGTSDEVLLAEIERRGIKRR